MWQARQPRSHEVDVGSREPVLQFRVLALEEQQLLLQFRVLALEEQELLLRFRVPVLEERDLRPRDEDAEPRDRLVKPRDEDAKPRSEGIRPRDGGTRLDQSDLRYASRASISCGDSCDVWPILPSLASRSARSVG